MSDIFSYRKDVHIEKAADTPLVEGAESDRLTVREVFRILPRTMPFILEQWKHLLTLVIVFGSIALVGMVVVLSGTDIFYTRLLVGEPLTSFQAWVLSLPKEQFVEVEALSAESRRLLRYELFKLMGIVAVMGVFTWFGALFYFTWVRQQINQSLRVTLMERVQNLSLRFHHNARTGDAIYRMYQDSAMVTLVIQLILDAIFDIVRFLIAILAICLFSVELAGLIFVISIAVAATCILVSTYLRTVFRVARETNSRLTSHIQASVAGLKVLKAYGIETDELKRFRNSQELALSGAFRARNAWALYGIAVFTFFAVGLLVGEAYSAWLAHLGRETWSTSTVLFVSIGYTLWNLGAFQAVKGRMAQSRVEPLAHKWGRLQELAVGLDRAFELLDVKPEVVDNDEVVPLEVDNFEVEFRHVSFSYDRVKPTLSNVNFIAEPSTIVAIVGPTGSGKSTILSMILRLFDPDEGQVLIGGRDIRQFSLASLRSHIAIALQENVLFRGSIRDNIAYAVPEATDDEVREAARLAAADDFVELLGWDTPLGERASRLSTGQRQRLSIARALIKNPDILILDEPTAALDARTEHRLLDNLHQWTAGKTVFIVTHRLSTIRGAHKILYVRDGTVVETGDHDTLMQEPDGAYRRFVELESGVLERQDIDGE